MQCLVDVMFCHILRGNYESDSEGLSHGYLVLCLPIYTSQGITRGQVNWTRLLYKDVK